MKKIYILSLKLFTLHVLLFGLVMSVYYFLVNIIFNAEKIFDILLLSNILKLAILAATFIYSVKIVKSKDDKTFAGHYRLVLLFYTANISFAVLLFLAWLFFRDSLLPGIFLIGGVILLLYLYYYFSRLAYYLAFSGKLRKTMAVSAILLAVGYLLILVLPIVNYQKAYEQTEVKADFMYFHSVDLSGIDGGRELVDRNSARDMVELINRLETDEEIKDKGEELSYILPTEDELGLLNRVADSAYLGFSREYFPEELYRTGDKLVVPLNGLRSLSRGAVKLAKSEAKAGHTEKAQAVLSDILYAGNQLISAQDGTLIGRLVGQAMMEEALEGMTNIYGESSPQAELAESIRNELNAMRDGSRLLRTYASHMNDEMLPQAEAAAKFFKHLEAEKDNISGDLDREIARSLFPPYYGFDPLHGPDLNKIEELTVSFLAAPIMAPFELNIGKDLMIYRQARKLSEEPNHEYLDYFLKNPYQYVIDWSRFADEYNSIHAQAFPSWGEGQASGSQDSRYSVADAESAIKNFMDDQDLVLEHISTSKNPSNFIVGKTTVIDDGAYRVDTPSEWERPVYIFQQKEYINDRCEVYEYEVSADTDQVVEIHVRYPEEIQDLLADSRGLNAGKCDSYGSMEIPLKPRGEIEAAAMEFLNWNVADFEKIKPQFRYTPSKPGAANPAANEWSWQDDGYEWPEGWSGDSPRIRIIMSSGGKLISYYNNLSLFNN